QQGQEALHRQVGMADGPDAARHQSSSRVSASSLCMATCSVLSLWISYCGCSALAWRGWPLYVVSRVCTRVIRPLTRPASEFQLTWSPTLNRGSMTLSSHWLLGGKSLREFPHPTGLSLWSAVPAGWWPT